MLQVTRPPASSAEALKAWQLAVDVLHEKYVAALICLYEQHRAAQGYADVKLVVE